jgi:hypothetical protein
MGGIIIHYSPKEPVGISSVLNVKQRVMNLYKSQDMMFKEIEAIKIQLAQQERDIPVKIDAFQRLSSSKTSKVINRIAAIQKKVKFEFENELAC